MINIDPHPLHEKIEDDLLKEIFYQSKNIEDFYKRIGYSSAKAVKANKAKEINNRIIKLGLNINDIRCANRKKRNKNNCLFCGKETYNAKYCSNECATRHRKKIKIETWLKTGDTGCGVSSTIRNCIRGYILERQNYKCSICGISPKWNGKELNFILDHINGDAANSRSENVRLICPNCDSQLKTYKSRNKNSARSFRTKNGKVAELGLTHQT